MNELQLTYEAARRGMYAHPNPDECGCSGGWYLSDVDTWHECPFHHRKGDPHPEFDYPEDHEAAQAEPRVYEWDKFTTVVVGYEIIEEDEDGKYADTEFHVVITHSYTKQRYVHTASTFKTKLAGYGLAKRVAQSGKTFRQLDMSHWGLEDEWIQMVHEEHYAEVNVLN